MHALLILDMQVGLFHGPDKPWAGEALLDTLNALLTKARSAGAPIFLARHVGPPGSPIEPGSPLTQLLPELRLTGNEVIFEKTRPNAFAMTDLVEGIDFASDVLHVDALRGLQPIADFHVDHSIGLSRIGPAWADVLMWVKNANPRRERPGKRGRPALRCDAR